MLLEGLDSDCRARWSLTGGMPTAQQRGGGTAARGCSQVSSKLCSHWCHFVPEHPVRFFSITCWYIFSYNFQCFCNFKAVGPPLFQEKEGRGGGGALACFSYPGTWLVNFWRCLLTLLLSPRTLHSKTQFDEEQEQSWLETKIQGLNTVILQIFGCVKISVASDRGVFGAV